MSGGHYLDTGEGPRPLTGLSGGAALLESEQRRAYQAYLNHGTGDCPDCPQSTFQCDEAARLYAVYKAVRR